VVRDHVQKSVQVKVRPSFISCLTGSNFRIETNCWRIILIEPDDIIPCDGILIAGQGVKCDESSPAGETIAAVKKTYYNLARLHPDCFMVAGSRVVEGTGRYLVVAAPEATSRKDLTSMPSIILSFKY